MSSCAETQLINASRSFKLRDTSRLGRVVQKLCKAQTVHIVVLGNSGTQGQACNAPKGYYNRGPPLLCAWPYRFLHFLRTAYPSATITLTNTARTGLRAADYARELAQLRPGVAKSPGQRPWHNPATAQAAGWGANDNAFASSRLAAADLVITDFGWSDWRQLNRTWEADKLGVPQEQALKIMNEELIVRLMRFRPHVALIYLETYIGCSRPLDAAPACRLSGALGGVQDLHEPVLQQYAVPQVSLRDAVAWAHLGGLEGWYRYRLSRISGAHPNWEGHQLLADLLAAFWRRVAALECRSMGKPHGDTSRPKAALATRGKSSPSVVRHPSLLALPPPIYRDKVGSLFGCGGHVLTRHDAMDDAAGFVRALQTQAAWQCDTESRRPGCLGNQRSGNLSLAVTCGARAQLHVTYVKSHASFGRANLALVHRSSGSELAHRLDANWDDPFSLMYVSEFSCAPPGEHVMHLSVESEQFKLVAVQTC